ncbi:hypothetical protein ETAA8_35240 [Anatilimnocola aggregata]|uniref:VWFA domain-containing protein n=1 Tax=Anatilimnocola aggregata TaxID=2528021 RepID=A0A517YDU6_9BACT|nr:hypothetical protein [Anatilimnocola aggregata]QDU28424.1 hypothetical protein ETAA8_35240 [Anatilimnocola aggregata]
MSPRPDSEGKSGGKRGPAWMGKRQAAGRAKVEQDWKKPIVRGSVDEYRYKFKRTALWIGCLLLFGVFVAYLIPPKNTPLVVFRATRYPLQMPPLSLAMEDEAFLKQISPSNLPLRESVPLRYIGASDVQSGEEDSRQRFLSRLKEVQPSGPGWFSRNDMVIIYISAHGLVNADGQACLVPPNADAFDTTRWLPISKLLSEISGLPNLKKSRKLVVLDCNRISTQWRCGVMDNRFADQLPSIVDHVNDPNLYVLNSTSPGQMAWAAPELKGSVFGHFLALGLRGDASHEHPQDASRGVVSLKELHAYLCDRVDGYVQQRRAARQTPMLIGPDGLEVTRDVPLVSADYWQAWRSPANSKSGFDVLGEAKRLIEGETSPLRQAWQAYQRLATAGPNDRASGLPIAWRRGFVMDPVRWASLEQRLLALEERLFAGEEYQAGLGNQLAALYDEFNSGTWHSLPPTQAITNLRLSRWEQMAADTLPVMTEENVPGYGAAFEKWLKDPPDERARFHIPPADLPRATSEMLERFGLTRAEETAPIDPFNSDRLKQMLEFLKIVDPKEPVPAEKLPIEAHFLKLLARGSNPTADRQMIVGIRARSLAEQAATPLDVRTHYAVENLVNVADGKRRSAEDLLFLGDLFSPEGPESLWRSARGTATEELHAANNSGYHGAIQRADTLGEMFLLRDEIWARFPYVAEWFFRRSRLALAAADIPGGQASEDSSRGRLEQQFNDHVTLLSEVLNANVTFAERLEAALLKRDNETELLAELQLAGEQYRQLDGQWRQLLDLLADDSRPREQEENRFLAGTSVRNIEQMMHTPVYIGARVEGLLAKYQNTLLGWSQEEQGARKAKSTAAKSPAIAADESVFREGYRSFLIQYHKLLTYEYKLPYEQHRTTFDLSREDVLAIDQQLRRQVVKDKRNLWQNVKNVFVDYDQAMQAKPVEAGKSSPAVQVRRDLSLWDRRVRSNATWMACFSQELVADQLAIPTPTAWLRDVDHWHLSCWHGHRALEDFWGNGIARDSSSPFFDIVATRCARAAQAEQLPFQYDLPNEPVEPLSDLQKSRLTAHDRGIQIEIEDVQLLDKSETKAIPVNAAAKQLSATVDRQPINFPAGSAGFFLSRAGEDKQLDAKFVTYGDKGKPYRLPVPIAARTNEALPTHKLPCVLQPTDLGRPPIDLAGHVWYRGHQWDKAFQFYYDSPDGGLTLVTERQSYSAPTVQVRGNDSPTGAILFVLDCSSSMTNKDGRFKTAYSALSTIVSDLKLVDKGGMQIGLMAYGHRTPNRGGYFPAPNDKMYYDDTKLASDPNNLTADGKAAATLYGPMEFKARYPHPDDDIELMYPPDRGWGEELPKRLATLNVNRCFGVTPLYAAVAAAIREVEKVEGVQSRQVIVVSDGVNMPNNCNLGHTNPLEDTIRPNGEIQNAKDFDRLDAALAASSDVKVRVVLFGDVKPGIETSQLSALKSLGAKYSKFELEQIKIPALIKQKIEEAFIKPTFTVAPADSDRRPQSALQFNDIWQFAEWPAQGDLIPPQDHLVTVNSPRLREPLQQKIQLSGGEALQLWFETGLSTPKLFFEADEMQAFGSQKLQAAGDIERPAKPIIVELVKPDVGEAKGDVRPTTFRLRLRTESNDEFIARPRYVWAEFRPLSTDPKHQDLVFQISDLRFENKTRTPVMLFPIPGWPAGVDAAEIKIWVRYGGPPLLVTQRITAADVALPTIFGDKHGLPGVELAIRQEIKPGTSRQIQIIENHPEKTPLARLYRTRVQLSLPADKIERTYFPSSHRVVHTFTYRSAREMAADISLELNSAEQIKDGSLWAPLQLMQGWNR